MGTTVRERFWAVGAYVIFTLPAFLLPVAGLQRIFKLEVRDRYRSMLLLPRGTRALVHPVKSTGPLGSWEYSRVCSKQASP